MLEKIKLLLNKDDKSDELLSILIGLCKDEALMYCNLELYDSRMDFVIIQMVVEKYNRIGSEGATSQSSSGAATVYDSFYSEKVQRALNKFRKVKTI